MDVIGGSAVDSSLPVKAGFGGLVIGGSEVNSSPLIVEIGLGGVEVIGGGPVETVVRVGSGGAEVISGSEIDSSETVVKSGFCGIDVIGGGVDWLTSVVGGALVIGCDGIDLIVPVVKSDDVADTGNVDTVLLVCSFNVSILVVVALLVVKVNKSKSVVVSVVVSKPTSADASDVVN